MITKQPPNIKRHALIIEDDDVDYQGIKRALSRSTLAFECERATTLSAVNMLVKTSTYDIIVTDMNLPDSAGLETVSSLLELTNKVPLVVMSGNGDDTIALEAVHAGAQDFIPKQYIADEGLINRTVRHAIERHQLKLGLDITREREHFLANYDQCTSLPNRALFIDRLQQEFKQATRDNNQFAVFFIDLDLFKHVNDSLGHAAGDEVLRCVGNRMKAVVRESDTVARFGGDEFVLILRDTGADHEVIANVANKFINTINKPIPYAEQTCNVGASIGIACFPSDGASPEQIIRNADTAMYEAKKNGKNQCHFFTKELQEQKSHVLTIENALRIALQEPDAQFDLHYQPRVNLATGNIFSVEALLRWNCPGLGNIPPHQFIPLAEEIGLIERVDEWVLEAACKKAVGWAKMEKTACIGVNLSGRSFNQPCFVSDVVKPLLTKYDIPAGSLEFEITEGILLENTENVLERLNALKQLGISLAIDDFGTGFSSLNYLNRFPIDTLKIDGSFICDESSGDSAQVLLKTIVTLGLSLGMKVVAECIETEAQRKFLTTLQCDEGQGYLWFKPASNWTPSTE